MSNQASVFPPQADIKVCLLGDDGIGKSTFIQAYVTQRFPPAGTVPAVLDPQQLRSSIAPTLGASSVGEALRDHNLIIIDAPALHDAAAVAAHLKASQPDVIMLCYSQSNPESLARLARFWLPAITDHLDGAAGGVWRPRGWPYIPIALCGLRGDEIDDAQAEGWRGVHNEVCALTGHNPLEWVNEDGDVVEGGDMPHTAAGWLSAAIYKLLLSYDCILSQHDVSALTPPDGASMMVHLGDTLYAAISLTMHPQFPLYDAHADAVTPAFEAALHRIFSVLDRDGDGLLSPDELAIHQEHTFHVRVTHAETTRLIDTSRVSHAQAPPGTPPYVDDLKGYMTFQGFKVQCINNMHSGHREIVWQTLRSFGYRYAVPPVTDASGPHPLATIKLTFPAEWAEAWPEADDASLTLLDTPGNDASAASYLTRVFRHHSSRTVASDALAMSPEAVTQLFACSESGTHPFGRLFPDIVRHNDEGGVSLATWLHLWRMLLVVDASAALRGLYDIGYARLLPTATVTGGSGAAVGGAGTSTSKSPSAAASASVGPTDGVLDFDPRNGVMADIPRKSSGDDAPAAVRRLFVVGSKGAGKSSLILHFVLEGRGGLDDHLKRLADEGEAVRPLPTTAPTHYAVPPVESNGDKDAAAGARRGAGAASGGSGTGATGDVRPKTYVITEWPSDFLEASMEAAAYQCDAMIFVVKVDDPDSIQYFLKAVHAVPDNVPCIVVQTRSETASGEAMTAGLAVMTDLCQHGDDSIALEAHADALGGAIPQVMKQGLGLELFKFARTSRFADSQEVFKLAMLAALTPSHFNPKTADRRWGQKKAQWAQAAKVGLTVAAVVAAGVIAWRYRSEIKGATAKAMQSVRDAVSGTRGKGGDGKPESAGAASKR